MRKIILLLLAIALIPVFACGQVVRPGVPGPLPSPNCQMAPQQGEAEGQGAQNCITKISWYRSPLPTQSCPALFMPPGQGNATQQVGDPDPFYNKRLFVVQASPTPAASPHGSWEPIVCDFDRTTGQQIAAGQTNAGGQVCYYSSTGHTEPMVVNLSHGYVGIWACGNNGQTGPTYRYTPAPIPTNEFWGDANGRGTGSSNMPMPFAIGNCVGSADCASQSNPMDITATANQFFLPAVGESEGQGATYGNVTLFCGQQGGLQVGGFQVGSQGCLTVRYVSPGVFSLDTACTVGGTVTAWTISATPENSACGGSWEIGVNVHAGLMGYQDFSGMTAASTISITFPAGGGFAGATCTYTGSGSVPSAYAALIAKAINSGTLSGTGCSSTGTYYFADTADTCTTYGTTCTAPTPSTTLSGAISAGATSMTVASGTGFAVGQYVTLSQLSTGVRETVQVTSVSGTTIGISATTYAHASGAQAWVEPTMVIFAKTANPPTMPNFAVSGCTGCTNSWNDRRADSAGAQNHFGYGSWGMRYRTDGVPIWCGIEDTQVITGSSYYEMQGYTNGSALNLLFFCSRGPDVTKTGATGTYGVWQWSDATGITNGSDGTYNTSPAWMQSVATGSSPAPGYVGFLSGPIATCTNAANTPCTSDIDASGTQKTTLGLVSPCTSPCSPPAGYTNFDLTMTPYEQATYSSAQQYPVAVTNYGWTLDSQNNALIAYVCSDSTKSYAIELCFVTLSGTTGQTLRAGFIEDGNTASEAQEPNLAITRAPSGNLVVLAAYGNTTTGIGCTASAYPCLMQYVSSNNGQTWTRTKLADPSWAGSQAWGGSMCSMNADPKGWHIYAFCVGGINGVTPPAPMYVYDLYLGAF